MLQEAVKPREQQLAEENRRLRQIVNELTRERDGYRRLAGELKRRLEHANFDALSEEVRLMRSELSEQVNALGNFARVVEHTRTDVRSLVTSVLTNGSEPHTIRL
jgi:uncharacterized protein YhaN